MNIEANKERYIKLLDNITSPEFNKQSLITYLEASDFFTAPASTKYHGSFEGGLCSHCLAVYDNMRTLVDMKGLNYVITLEEITVVALFHDLSKINFYTLENRNKKFYSDSGSKTDAGGKYDWVVVKEYGVKPIEERFVYGSHEQTAEYLASCFLPLTISERQAILYHMGGMAKDSIPDMVTTIYGMNNLAVILHLADMLASYVDKDEQIN